MSSLFGLGGGGNVGASGSFYSYSIDQSLRFDAASESELSKTFVSGGNRRKWTFSTWIKRSKLTPSGNDQYIFGTNTGAADSTFMFLNWRAGDDLIVTGQSTLWLRSDRVFRDVSGWYHIVWSLDTDNATASQRMRLYINGSELTSFSTDSRLSLSGDQAINAAVEHNIGRHPSSTGYALGAYLAETHFVDGQALSPSDFGETSNGIWLPKSYSGSYGTTGFYLSYADSAAVGCDKAGSKTLVTSTSFSTIGGGTTNFSQSEADKGFDNDISTNVDRTGTSGLIEITPTSAVTPVSHTMINANSTTYTAASRPNSVKLQGSNDGGSTWTDIDTLTNGSGANTATTSSFSNTTSYAKLRLNIASNHGGSNTRFAEYVVFASEDNGDGENIFFKANVAAHDVVPDSPTNNFATYNQLVYSTATYAEGNLKFDAGGWSSSYWGSKSTFAIPKDKKIYIELEETATGGVNYAVGIATDSAIPTGSNIGGTGSITLYHTEFKINGTSTAHGQGSSVAGDIIGIAVDGSTGEVWFSRNGTWFTTGGAGADPSTGTDPIGTVTNPDDEDLFLVVAGNTSTSNLFVNFGQDSQNVASANADANGIGTFEYAVPTDHVCLCASSLSEPAIGPNSDTQADDYFKTMLWSGNSTNNRSITTDHATDLIWIKKRGTTAQTHVLADSVRGTSDNGGTGNVGILAPNDIVGVSTNSSDSGIASFDSTGFTIGAGSNTANADAPYQGTNASGHTYVGWSWKAGGTAVSNSEGSQTCNVSANTDAGFSIVSWTASSATGTVGHGLDSAPEIIFAKPLESGTNWYVMHTPGGVVPANKILNLDSTADDFDPGNNHFNDTYPTDTVFSYGGYLGNALSNDDKVAYCFHSVEGFSKVGSFKGNSSASNGPFVYTGFRPSFVMGKAIGQTGRWWMYDSARTTYNDGGVNNGRRLEANSSSAESTSDSSNMVEFYSNGFKVNTTNGEWNSNGLNYIYIAFAEAGGPFKYSRAR